MRFWRGTGGVRCALPTLPVAHRKLSKSPGCGEQARKARFAARRPMTCKQRRRYCPRASIRCIGSVILLLCIHQVMLAQSGQQARPNNGASGAVPVRVPLTLRRAVQLALKQNPQELVARIQVEQRRRETDLAMSNLLPQVAIDSKITVWRYNFQSIAGGDTPNAIGPFQVLDFGGRFSQNVLNLPLIRHYQSSRENIVAAEAALNGTREDIVSATVTSLSAVHPEVG
jgi:Outer membrane efflux protein